MKKTTVTAYVPKSTNSVWTGRGSIVSINLDLGLVIIAMTSGEQKGCVGGFDIDKINFHMKREEVTEVTEAL